MRVALSLMTTLGRNEYSGVISPITLCNTQKSTRDLWPFLYAKRHGKPISGLLFVELGIVFTELSLYTLLVIIIK